MSKTKKHSDATWSAKAGSESGWTEKNLGLLGGSGADNNRFEHRSRNVGRLAEAVMLRLEQQKVGMEPPPAQIRQAAQAGISGAGGPLPHQEAIQQSFGHHDISGVRAHVGGAAAQATSQMGAEAYATGNDVAFKSAPSLHTAAHEAAHVVQQRSGKVQLKGGVGQVGDIYEQHADQVADLVVQGKSAAPLLDRFTGGAGHCSVQMKEEGGDKEGRDKEGGESGKENDGESGEMVYTWTYNGQTHKNTKEQYEVACSELVRRLRGSVVHEAKVKAGQARFLYDFHKDLNAGSPLVAWCAEVLSGSKLPPTRIVELAGECADKISKAAEGTGSEGLKHLKDTIYWAEPLINSALNRLNAYTEGVGLGAERSIALLHITKTAGVTAAGIVLAAAVAPAAATAVAASEFTGTSAAVAESMIVSGTVAGSKAAFGNILDQYIDVQTGDREGYDNRETATKMVRSGLIGASTGGLTTHFAPPVSAKLFPKLSPRLASAVDESGTPVLDLFTPKQLEKLLRGPLSGLFGKAIKTVAEGIESSAQTGLDWISEQTADQLVTDGIEEAVLKEAKN